MSGKTIKRTASPSCVVSAGATGAVSIAVIFLITVNLLRANLVWGGRNEGSVILLSAAFGFIVVLSVLALMRLKYRVDPGQGFLVAYMTLAASPLVLVAIVVSGEITHGGKLVRMAATYSCLYSAFMVGPAVPGSIAAALVATVSRRGEKSI